MNNFETTLRSLRSRTKSSPEQQARISSKPPRENGPPLSALSGMESVWPVLGGLGLLPQERAVRSRWIGGSDANILLSGYREKILKLWRIKRGEAPEEDLSPVLAVMLGCWTEPFTQTCVDHGTSLIVEAYGEALDAGDKATAKVTSTAYKSAMVQTFCIPICVGEDPDKMVHRLSAKSHAAEPMQGWQQWSADIIDMTGVCESEQTIGTVRDRQRELLKALSRERPDLYAELGLAFSNRRERLKAAAATNYTPRRPRAVKPRSRRTGELEYV